MATHTNSTTQPPLSFGDLLDGLPPVPAGVRPADAPELGFGLNTPITPQILAENLDFGQEVKSFGTNHRSGENAQLQSLADFAALAHFIGGIDPESELSKEIPALNELLATHRNALNPTLSDDQITNLESAMRQAGEMGIPLSDSFAAAAEAAGISLEDQEAQKARALAEEEVRRLEARAAAAAQNGAGSHSGPINWARPEKVAGELTADTQAKMVEATGKALDIAQAAGYPALTRAEEALIEFAVWKEAEWQRTGLDPSYLVPNLVMGAYEYGGAAISTGAAAISEAYDAYKEAGGEWTPEEWQETAKGKANAVWDALAEQIGEEGAAKFKAASQTVSDRQAWQLASNIGSWVADDGARRSQRAGYELSAEDLAFFIEHHPDVVVALFGNETPDLEATKVKMQGLFDTHRTPNMAKYAGMIANTDQGPHPDQGGVPINESFVDKGIGPMNAFFKANGKTYPVDGNVAAQLGTVPHFKGQSAIPAEEVDTPDEGHGLPKARPLGIDGNMGYLGA
jgi:hypothetical protein